MVGVGWISWRLFDGSTDASYEWLDMLGFGGFPAGDLLLCAVGSWGRFLWFVVGLCGCFDVGC